jgi:hypothetical protein
LISTGVAVCASASKPHHPAGSRKNFRLINKARV